MTIDDEHSAIAVSEWEGEGSCRSIEGAACLFLGIISKHIKTSL